MKQPETNKAATYDAWIESQKRIGQATFRINEGIEKAAREFGSDLTVAELTVALSRIIEKRMSAALIKHIKVLNEEE